MVRTVVDKFWIWDSFEVRVESATLSPSQISESLSISPTEAFERGAPYDPSRPEGRKFEQTIWLLAEHAPAGSNISAIEAVLDKIVGLEERFLNLQPEAAVEVSWHGAKQGWELGAFIEPALITRFARMGAGVHIAFTPEEVS